MWDNNSSFESAAEILCDEIRSAVLAVPDSKKNSVQEIRLRTGKAIALSDGTTTMFMDKNGRILYSLSENALKVTQRQLYDTFRRLCSYSVYSFQDEIKNGFITIRGGHRVGLCGTAVTSDGTVSAINDISSLNIRISREIRGVSEELLKHVYPFKGGVLIAGAPSSGKTTLLRDLAYHLSLGDGCKIMRTAVIDERGELSGTYNGNSYNDLGLCDILNGYPKGEGIIQAIRSLSPQIIICDELGTDEDSRLVSQGLNAGVTMIATIHASDKEELFRRRQARELIRTGAFANAVILDGSDRPCRIKEVVPLTCSDISLQEVV